MTMQAIHDATAYVRAYFESLEAGDWVCIAQIIGALVFFKVLIHMIMMHEDFYYKCLRKLRSKTRKMKESTDVEADPSPALTPQMPPTPEVESSTSISGWLAHSLYGPHPTTSRVDFDQVSIISVPSLTMSSGGSEWDTESMSSPMSPKPEAGMGMDLSSVIHDNYLSTRAQV